MGAEKPVAIICLVGDHSFLDLHHTQARGGVHDRFKDFK